MAKRHLLYEALILVICFAVFNPHKPLPQINQDDSRYLSVHTVATALGIVQRGFFPSFTPEIGRSMLKLWRTEPATFLNTDLRRLYPADTFPVEPMDAIEFRGGEGGHAHLIAWVWSTTGTYTVAAWLVFCNLLHDLAILAIFLALAFFRRPGLALLGALALAYSPTLAVALQGFTPYFFSPLIAIFVTTTTLAVWIGWQRGVRWPWVAAGVCTCGVIAAAGAAIRTTNLYLLVPLSVLFLFAAHSKKKMLQGIIAVVILVSAALTVKTVFDRKIWSERALSISQQKNHLFWHAIWCGLGEFPNPYQFQWRDRAGYEYALSVDPTVVLASDTYEHILRNRVVTVVTHDPLWLAGVFAKRLWSIAANWSAFIPGPLTGLPLLARFIFVAGLGWFAVISVRRRDWAAWILVIPLLFELLIPLLIYSGYPLYNLTANLGVVLALLYAAFVGCPEIRNRHHATKTAKPHSS